MGAFTPNGQVWFPDESDTSKLDVLLATVASSIEDGIVTRLKKVERNMALVANIAANQTCTNGTNAVANFSITAQGFNNGFTFSGGTITITVPGLYMFSANLLGSASTLSSQGFLQGALQKNGANFVSSITNLSSNGGSNVAGVSIAAAMQCVVGDTIRATALFAGATAGTLILSAGSSSAWYNTFTATLLKES